MNPNKQTNKQALSTIGDYKHGRDLLGLGLVRQGAE